jgi:NADH-quinone oxidoreductase subunit A
MSEQYLLDLIYISIFLLLGVIAAFAPFIISLLVRPKSTTFSKTLDTYECGVDTYGTAWGFRFGIAYYLYALIFLAFDVDILYLFPVGAAFDKVSTIRGITEFFIFVGILSLAIVYAWAKGVFEWEKIKKY